MSLPTLTPRRLALGAVLAMGIAAPAFVVPALAAPAANAAPTTNEQAETAGVQAAHVAPEAAIRAGEAKAGGRAISFGLEHTATLNAYEVLVAGPTGALSKVDVNPTTGAATLAGPAGRTRSPPMGCRPPRSGRRPERRPRSRMRSSRPRPPGRAARWRAATRSIRAGWR